MQLMRLAISRVTENGMPNSSMIDVAIRFDDPSAVSDLALERALLRIMDTHQVCATFAVIPHAGQHPLLAGNVPHLLEGLRQGTLEIAQHGFNHVAAHPNAAVPSEFAGTDPATQMEKIAAGRAILEHVFGTPINGFVPPFNTFDHHTAAALSGQGFRYLSAGSEHGVIETGGLAQLPRTCQIVELERALSEARRRPHGQLAIVAVMHHYDFKEFGQADAPLSLHRITELFKWLRQQADIRLNTLNELAARHDSASWRQAVKRSRWVERQHWRIRTLFPRYSLMPRTLINYVRLEGPV
jgi:predicted deacetylase